VFLSSKIIPQTVILSGNNPKLSLSSWANNR